MKLHADGWRRNLVRFRQDYQAMKDMQDGRPIDWIRKPWDVHAWVDMFREASKDANGGFLMAHWWAVYFPVSIAAMSIMDGIILT